MYHPLPGEEIRIEVVKKTSDSGNPKEEHFYNYSGWTLLWVRIRASIIGGEFLVLEMFKEKSKKY